MSRALLLGAPGRTMQTPLPPDIVDRISRDFGSGAERVLAIFDARRRSGAADYLGNRMVRCLVFLAAGSEARLADLIDLERLDFRDVIAAAEYDSADMRRLRDFDRPFGSAELG